MACTCSWSASQPRPAMRLLPEHRFVTHPRRSSLRPFGAPSRGVWAHRDDEHLQRAEILVFQPVGALQQHRLGWSVKNDRERDTECTQGILGIIGGVDQLRLKRNE